MACTYDTDDDDGEKALTRSTSTSTHIVEARTYQGVSKPAAAGSSHIQHSRAGQDTVQKRISNVAI